jgi:hypothetical protein
MRHNGIDPAGQTADQALAVLDDLSRLHPDGMAAYWYIGASKAQLRLFDRDWRYWLTTHVL